MTTGNKVRNVFGRFGTILRILDNSMVQVLWNSGRYGWSHIGALEVVNGDNDNGNQRSSGQASTGQGIGHSEDVGNVGVDSHH